MQTVRIVREMEWCWLRSVVPWIVLPSILTGEVVFPEIREVTQEVIRGVILEMLEKTRQRVSSV